jgi:cation diffusion facilitator CzcD-associated flavoprotein CzcO
MKPAGISVTNASQSGQTSHASTLGKEDTIMATPPNLDRSTPTPPGRRSVAVVGAGISGVTAAGHLLREGLQVRLFERSSISGGAWHFDPRISDSPTYPSVLPSVGDYQTTVPGQFGLVSPPTPPPDAVDGGKESQQLLVGDAAAVEISFSPPSPCYAGLKNNVPTELMISSLGPWPAGTTSHVSQKKIEEYVQALAQSSGVDEIAEYNTRVEEIKKSPDGRLWTIRTLKLQHAGGRPHFEERTLQFDAVVVATGHYNLPLVPNIPGLREWKEKFGDRVIHSKQYRDPTPYKDQTVLVVGCGVSAMDISRELGRYAKRVYQSARGGQRDLPATLLLENATRVGPVERFEVIEETTSTKGTVVLKDGTIIEGIDRMIIATGYIKSYPFLSDLHDDTLPAEKAGPRLLVSSEGTMTHNLHKDIFYIEDPTLTFVGVPYHTATFSLFDFQSQVVARVLSGKAQLPPAEEMRALYVRRVQEKGVGRDFHSLAGETDEEDYVRELVQWVNEDAAKLGYEPMKGHTEEWVPGKRAMKKRFKAILDGQLKEWPGAN